MNKRIFTATLFSVFVMTAFGDWRGINDASHLSGPKITPDDLKGKVVLVEMWGVDCPPCRASLPKMEKLWNAFKHKPFILLGSHCQLRNEAKIKGLVDSNKLTYPIYDHAGWNPQPAGMSSIPFIYVIDHRGKVVYAHSGCNEQGMTEAVVNAITQIGAPPSVSGGFIFKPNSQLKAFEKQLVLGRPVAPVVKKLEGIVKKGGSKLANEAQKAAAAEASELIKCIAEAKGEVKAEVDAAIDGNPEEACKLINSFIKSYPDMAAEYKAKIPEVQAAAKERKAAKKAAEAGAKKGASGKKGAK